MAYRTTVEERFRAFCVLHHAGSEGERSDRRLRRTDWALLAAATVLAAVLRWQQLEVIPPGLHHDEAIEGLAGRAILEGRFFLLYGFDVREPLFYWLVAAGELLWGASALAVRGAAALVGTVTVPLVYLLATRLFNRWVGVCTAFALAFSIWHVTLSRFGVRAILVPLFLVITCYFLALGF